MPNPRDSVWSCSFSLGMFHDRLNPELEESKGLIQNATKVAEARAVLRWSWPELGGVISKSFQGKLFFQESAEGFPVRKFAPDPLGV